MTEELLGIDSIMFESGESENEYMKEVAGLSLKDEKEHMRIRDPIRNSLINKMYKALMQRNKYLFIVLGKQLEHYPEICECDPNIICEERPLLLYYVIASTTEEAEATVNLSLI